MPKKIISDTYSPTKAENIKREMAELSDKGSDLDKETMKLGTEINDGLREMIELKEKLDAKFKEVEGLKKKYRSAVHKANRKRKKGVYKSVSASVCEEAYDYLKERAKTEKVSMAVCLERILLDCKSAGK